MDTCPKNCGEMIPGTITHTESRNGQNYVFLNLPATICHGCGEAYVTEETLQRVDQLIASGNPPLTVPTWDMASA